VQKLVQKLNHAFVCGECNQARLRDNAAAQPWLALRDDGLMSN